MIYLGLLVMQFAPSPCVIFVYVLLLTPMFALGTVKSPVFSLVHDRYHLNKRTAEGRSWCCFCQESQVTYSSGRNDTEIEKVST